MNQVARNNIQNELGLPRTVADWITEHLERGEIDQLCPPTPVEPRVIRQVVSEALKRYGRMIYPPQAQQGHQPAPEKPTPPQPEFLREDQRPKQ